MAKQKAQWLGSQVWLWAVVHFTTFYLCDFPEYQFAISVGIFIRKKLVTVKHTISIWYYCHKKGQEPIKMIGIRNMKYSKYKRGKSVISEGYSCAFFTECISEVCWQSAAPVTYGRNLEPKGHVGRFSHQWTRYTELYQGAECSPEKQKSL